MRHPMNSWWLRAVAKFDYWWERVFVFLLALIMAFGVLILCQKFLWQ